MKSYVFKLLVLGVLSLVCKNQLRAQKRTCGTMQHQVILQQKEPALIKKREGMEEQLQKFQEILNTDHASKYDKNIIRIPVVVHVVYNDSVENISTAQILSQIRILNEDFRRTNSDSVQTISAFRNLAADCGIEFCLATRDPDGNPTTGITRTATNVTSFSAWLDDVKFDSLGGQDIWDRNRYLNMWVCNLGGLLGYAQFPGGGADTDGIVVDYRSVGDIGTAEAPFNLGRTVTHEVGHWLNLYHIWGDGDCSQDDGVSDTPSSDGPNFGCNLNHFSCDSLDMVQNYMDYSDDACMNIFSKGQSNRMRAAILLFRPTFLTFSHLVVNNNPINSDVYGASISVSSTGSVLRGAKVSFEAGEEIHLRSNFRVQNGGIFKAKVNACVCTGQGLAREALDTMTDHTSKSQVEVFADLSVSESNINIYPNPVYDGQTNLEFLLPERGLIRIYITDMKGVFIQNFVEEVFVEKGWNKKTIELDNYTPGVYYIVLMTPYFREVKKIVIQ